MRLVIAALCAFAAGPVAAQDKPPPCDKPGKPALEYSIDAPRGPGAGPGYVRHQLMSRTCNPKGRMSWKQWLVVDERGKTLYAGREIIPLSARHGVVGGGFGGMSVQVYGKKPGPPLPYRWPGLARTLTPGASAGSIPDRPVIVAPIAVGSPEVKAGDSTTVTMALFTGDSFEPKLIGGLGGRAVFGTDVFGTKVTPNDSTSNFRAADFVMPRDGVTIFQNFTAPDGTGLAQMIDRTGEPVGAPIGQVDLWRVPERTPGRYSGKDSPLVQLASRVAPLGAEFPGMWLYMPLDREGQPVAPLPGAVGYSVLRPSDINDPPLWGAVYRGKAGYEVALSTAGDGRLPTAVQPERHAGLRFVDVDNYVKSYSAVGLSPSTGRWSVLTTDLNGPRRGAPNSFASAQAAIGAIGQWQAQYNAEAQRREAEWRAAAAANRAREAEQARAGAVRNFETRFALDYFCFALSRDEAAAIGDDYLKRWYERCDIPFDLFADARRLGVSQPAFDRTMQSERNRQARAAELRAMGARANGFAEAMAAYRTTAGAAPTDPWVAVRVTQGGRTTTEVMRQSEYDRRRP